MQGVTRQFGETVAVAGIDLEVRPGTVVGIVGPSGSGKTTAIRMITGSIAPTGGRGEVLGEPPAAFHRGTRRRIGYMPQKFSLYPDLTVLENVDFAASLYGLLFWRRWARRRAVLELVELWDVRGRRARDLSGGMQRRLELAAALVHEPDLVVLDEPTAGLDPILRETVWQEVHRLRDTGATVLVTTQYVTEAEQCDEVVLIVDGRVLASGTPDELRRAAFGGEVLDVTTKELFDAAHLGTAPGIRHIRQTGPRDFQLVVDDAGEASADAVQAVSGDGVEVVSVREHRASFEEVFTELVRRELDGENVTADEVAGDEVAAAERADRERAA
ncbi:MAG: ABC transporter ATP-binding protein [Chloroflexi bacterium]|nr:ABC transporter ATP-binding protein [Chloroflexota bacterium]